MASRSVSPGGALLRASRVFSMPAPLPRPSGELSSKGAFTSDSTTLPHPIHMSITTPQSSLLKGDWGLKRSLPLRATTKSSTPVIRIERMDTFEHVTEFGSAADHTISLKKWHEMRVPLTTPKPKNNSITWDRESGRSVFEDEIDTTATSESDADSRWKFDGPWIAGQTDGEFNKYLEKEVRKRKGEFQQFLRIACAKQLFKDNREQRVSAESTDAETTFEAENVTKEQMRTYVKALRNDLTELYKQIRSFLDLPPAPDAEKKTEGLVDSFASIFSKGDTEAKADLTLSSSPYRDSGPPKTHPSAGLAYSRTASILDNHPMWGPQEIRSPIEARIVKPRGTAASPNMIALGVGGFITDTPTDDPVFNPLTAKTSRKDKQPTAPGLQFIEPEVIGGGKVYVQPKYAVVDPKGRVVLQIKSADATSVAIKEGKAGLMQRPPPPRHISPVGATRTLKLDRGTFDEREGPKSDYFS